MMPQDLRYHAPGSPPTAEKQECQFLTQMSVLQKKKGRTDSRCAWHWKTEERKTGVGRPREKSRPRRSKMENRLARPERLAETQRLHGFRASRRGVHEDL
ncbi:hypothetical protein NDU88_003968 [Pleurodeles waltl]|uniref:Uncharacterized protein n=1 Tax=Pleurodeles waltl TaxID=8319 RepID=A0AAV7UDL4_PLEWA|nr:hypothetical protein NDU88_003968 [Pleurodeles waltl]